MKVLIEQGLNITGFCFMEDSDFFKVFPYPYTSSSAQYVTPGEFREAICNVSMFRPDVLWTEMADIPGVQELVKLVRPCALRARPVSAGSRAGTSVNVAARLRFSRRVA